MKVAEILKRAYAEVGVKEYPPSSNCVKYNDWYYGKTVSGGAYPWCVVFIEWLFRDEPKLLLKTASSTTLMNWFKKYYKFSMVPQVGDIVFFNFDKLPQKGVAKHVGIVVEVNGSSIKTCEGNTSTTSNDNGGAVMIRNRSGKCIVGYGRVDYEEAKPCKSERNTIRFGDKCDDVKYLHSKLFSIGYGVNRNSDYFDSTTKLCVINFQANNLLNPDGVVGPMTWREIDKIGGMKNGK